MDQRLVKTFWRTLVFACLAISACATAQEAPIEHPRIVAIGDLHGDYEAYEALLREAGLSDRRGRWTGGGTIFVQTGDIPDRGPDSLKIIEHLRKLQTRAKRDGGQVVTLIGNHESMNVIGDDRYVHPGEYKAFATHRSKRVRDLTFEKNQEFLEEVYNREDPTLTSDQIRQAWLESTPLGKLEHRLAWRANGEIGRWIAGNATVALIHGNLFAHGGFSDKFAQFDLDEINAMTSEALRTEDTADDDILYDRLGTLWYRGNVLRTKEDNGRISIEDEVELVLATYNAKRIIIGHTTERNGIRPSVDGRVIQIDTGISDYYGGAQSWLEIINGEVTAHNNGVATPINETTNSNGEDE